MSISPGSRGPSILNSPIIDAFTDWQYTASLRPFSKGAQMP